MRALMQGEQKPAADGPDEKPRRSIGRAVLRWLAPAVVVTVVLTIAAILVQYPSVESDLEQRVAARMVEAGINWVSVAVDGREVVLTGTAPEVDAQQNALEVAAGVWGVAGVRDRMALVPLASPFTWSADKDGNFLVLSGNIPSEAMRVAVRDLIDTVLPGTAVDDRTELARGAPAAFRSGVEFALRVLANLDSGRVDLADLDVTIEGLATDGLHYENALEITDSGLPTGFAVAAADIEPPLASPYVWSITISDSVTVLSGSVPSRAVADALVAAAGAAFSGAVIDDRMELASGAPDNFPVMANHMLDLAAMLGSGELVLTDSNLSVSGRARSPEDYENILAALQVEQPAGLAITYQDVAPSVAEAYVLEVVRSSNGVELIGFMPSEDAKAEVLEEAYSLFGQDDTEDQLQIADGAPRMDWIGAAKFALDQVAQLSGGSARISDFSYSITGAAASSEAYEALRAQLAGTLPASLVLNNVLLSAPVASPYRFSVTVGPETVTLAGVVPSPELRDLVADAAARRFTSLTISNEMLLASGAPVGFDDAVIAGLQAISRLEAGRFELVDLTVQVSGVAPYEGAIARIEEQLRAALPDGFTLTTNLTAAPPQSRVTPAACQELLTTELGEGGIQFGEGSAAIAPESEGRNR